MAAAPEHYEVKRFTNWGFEWTYEGPSPQQLALAILYDHLGDKERAIRLSEPFMKKVVADMDNDWTLRERRDRPRHQGDRGAVIRQVSVPDSRAVGRTCDGLPQAQEHRPFAAACERGQARRAQREPGGARPTAGSRR